MNHGSTSVIHAPIYHSEPIAHVSTAHTYPVYATEYHTGLVHTMVHAAPVLQYGRSGDSAVSHTSSDVHHTVPIVNLHH